MSNFCRFSILLVLLLGFVSISASQETRIPRIPIGRDGSRTAWVDFSTVPMGWGLARSATATQEVRWEKHLGSKGLVPEPESPDPSIYLGVAPGFLWWTTGTFFLAVEYWDSQPGAFSIQYMSDVGSATPTEDDILTKRFYTGGTQRWQRQNVALWSAQLENAMTHDSSIRLIPPGTPIRRVILTRQPLGEIDRVRPWGAEKEVAEPPESFSIFVRPSDEERLIRNAGTPRFDQRMGLYASWGAEAIVLRSERADLIGKTSLRDSPVYSWASVFRDTKPGVILDISTAGATESALSIWDSREIQRWEEAARTIGRIGMNRWPHGVVIDLRNTVGFEPSHALEIVWDAPEIVDEFRLAVRKKYGTLPNINRAWGTEYRRNDQIVPFLGRQAPSPQAAEFVEEWLRDRQVEYLDNLLETCRSALPQTRLFLWLPCRADWGTLPPDSIARITSRHDAFFLTVAKEFNPVLDPKWLLLAKSFRHHEASFGLEVRETDGGILSSALFALANEGGDILLVSEDQLARPGVLDTYRTGADKIGGTRQPRSIGVLYPWLPTEADSEFAERFGWIRDGIPVDLVSPEDLVDPSFLSDYTILIHLKGTRWPAESFSGLEQWIRRGNLFIFSGGLPFRDREGNLEIMTRLFPLELSRDEQGLEPISRGFNEISILSPFEELRAAWVKEVGLGFTFYVPDAGRYPAEYADLVCAIATNPSAVDPRLRRDVGTDGLMDGLFRAFLDGDELILNLTAKEQIVSDRRQPVTIPPWGLARLQK